MIRAIAAIDEARGIAAAGHPPYDIPWDIPTDTAYYKQKTSDAIVLMGRGTYDTFSMPLPNRRNVVVSANLQKVRDGFELINDLDAFLNDQHNLDVWVIGGAKLYEAALDYCQELYLTHINGLYDCDAFFPEYKTNFRLVDQTDVQTENGYEFRFAVYTKKPVSS